LFCNVIPAAVKVLARSSKLLFTSAGWGWWEGSGYNTVVEIAVGHTACSAEKPEHTITPQKAVGVVAITLNDTFAMAHRAL